MHGTVTELQLSEDRKAIENVVVRGEDGAQVVACDLVLGAHPAILLLLEADLSDARKIARARRKPVSDSSRGPYRPTLAHPRTWRLSTALLPLTSRPRRVLATIRESYNPDTSYVTIELPYPDGFEEKIANVQMDWGITGSLFPPALSS